MTKSTIVFKTEQSGDEDVVEWLLLLSSLSGCGPDEEDLVVVRGGVPGSSSSSSSSS